MAFKFLNNKDLLRMMGGSLKLGRLRYYQLLEAVYGKPWIGDVDEGAAITFVDEVHIQGQAEGDELKRTAAARVGIGIQGGTNITVQNCRAIREFDCFVLCLTDAEFEEAKGVMADPRQSGDCYGACIEIPSVRTLAQKIMDEGETDAGPVRDLFDVAVGQVTYEDTRVDATTGEPLSASPFRKRRQFARQKEIRIVLTPKGKIGGDAVFVRVPQFRSLASVRMSGEPDGVPVERRDDRSSEVKKAELQRRVDELLDRYDADIRDIIGLSWDDRIAALQGATRRLEERFWVTEQKALVQLYWDLRAAGLQNDDVDRSLVYLGPGFVQQFVRALSWMLRDD